MRRLVYSFGVSLDGYIAGPDGTFDWAAPGDELHRFHNEQARETGMQLYGRRLWEVMRFWETAEERPLLGEPEREFARIWKATPKLVFSGTLDDVEGSGVTLVREDPVAVVERLKEEPGKDLAVGGAGLASALIERGLVDEYRLFVNPVVAGGGTPYFPSLEERLDLELVETRTFSPVVYLRYRVRSP